MTKNVTEKTMASYHKFLSKNIAKSREWNNAEPHTISVLF